MLQYLPARLRPQAADLVAFVATLVTGTILISIAHETPSGLAALGVFVGGMFKIWKAASTCPM